MSSSVPRTGAQSVERAISVLYAFEGETRPLSISEVAGRVGLPVSTTHRIAQALVRGRLLARDGHNSYVVGDGITALAHAASRRIDVDAMAPPPAHTVLRDSDHREPRRRRGRRGGHRVLSAATVDVLRSPTAATSDASRRQRDGTGDHRLRSAA